MKERIINIPNTFTTFRGLLTIPLILFILTDNPKLALITLLIALITEIDGTFARLLKQETIFGSRYDPIIDGIFITGGLAALILTDKLNIYLMIALGIVNIPRALFIKLFIKKNGRIKSAIMSKISVMLIAIIIPLAIINFQYINGYIMFSIMICFILMLKKSYDYYKN